jgi:hypothetical protein
VDSYASFFKNVADLVDTNDFLSGIFSGDNVFKMTRHRRFIIMAGKSYIRFVFSIKQTSELIFGLIITIIVASSRNRNEGKVVMNGFFLLSLFHFQCTG